MDFETPNYYDNDGFQPFDVMRQFMSKEAFAGFCVGNVIKYIMRYDKKNGVDDVKKAAHYCEILYKELSETTETTDVSALSDKLEDTQNKPSTKQKQKEEKIETSSSESSTSLF